MNGLFQNDIRKEIKEMATRIDNIVIDGAEIYFKNFSGKRFKDGVRKFGVFVDDIADKLRADGWNVKMTKVRDEDDIPRPYLDVKVRFDNFPPKVLMIRGTNITELDEVSVSLLDSVYITNARVVIGPSSWTMNGKSGITAYLRTLYATIEDDDPFASDYADFTRGNKDDDLPF